MKSEEKLGFYDYLNTKIGKIYVVVTEEGLEKIEIIEDKWNEFINLNRNIQRDKEKCKDIIIQLEEYFNGTRKNFDLKLDIKGTEFRKKVWQNLLEIPYGETRSYRDVASYIGNEKAVRAIGQANRYNPIPIVIPCHRVISKSGKLVGYAGDHTDIQSILIEHERLHK